MDTKSKSKETEKKECTARSTPNEEHSNTDSTSSRPQLQQKPITNTNIHRIQLLGRTIITLSPHFYQRAGHFTTLCAVGLYFNRDLVLTLDFWYLLPEWFTCHSKKFHSVISYHMP